MNAASSDRSIEALMGRICVSVWQRKILFVISSTVIFCMIMVWVLGRQPVYEATAILVAGQPGMSLVQSSTRPDSEPPVALLARIAASDEVVKAAGLDVGFAKFEQPVEPSRPSLFARLRKYLYPDAIDPVPHVDHVNSTIAGIQSGLIVRSEQNANIVRISYRSSDPALAANFANAVATRFIERQMVIVSRLGAADFFLQQRQRFEQEVKLAAKSLQAFSARTNVFSAEAQRELLLKRRDALSLAMAATKGIVVQKIAERQSFADELRKLIPVSRSLYVSSLVDALGGERAGPRQDSKIIDDRTTDPPLLLIRVYQETMASLFKANSDLLGAQSLLKQQADEIENVTGELNRLLENQEEFVRLKSDVDLATHNLETYSKRMIEEQIDAEMNRARFSTIRILQQATPATSMVFPNYRLMAIAAGAIGILGGAVLALIFRPRSRRKREFDSASATAALAQNVQCYDYPAKDIHSWQKSERV